MRRVGDKEKLRLGVIGSGKGSNLVAMAEACHNGALDASIALVLSDVENAGILAIAGSFGLHHQFVEPGNFRTKLDEDAEQAFVHALRAAEIDLVVLTGFMRILKGEFLRAFENRVVNIHPSLLPSFPGLEAWKQAFDYGVKVSGCTIHFVDQGIDTGRIIAQKTVEIREDDTAESLHARIQEAEHELYPTTIARISRGEIAIG